MLEDGDDPSSNTLKESYREYISKILSKKDEDWLVEKVRECGQNQLEIPLILTHLATAYGRDFEKRFALLDKAIDITTQRYGAGHFNSAKILITSMGSLTLDIRISTKLAKELHLKILEYLRKLCDMLKQITAQEIDKLRVTEMLSTISQSCSDWENSYKESFINNCIPLYDICYSQSPIQNILTVWDMCNSMGFMSELSLLRLLDKCLDRLANIKEILETTTKHTGPLALPFLFLLKLDMLSYDKHDPFLKDVLHRKITSNLGILVSNIHTLQNGIDFRWSRIVIETARKYSTFSSVAKLSYLNSLCGIENQLFHLVKLPSYSVLSLGGHDQLEETVHGEDTLENYACVQMLQVVFDWGDDCSDQLYHQYSHGFIMRLMSYLQEIIHTNKNVSPGGIACTLASSSKFYRKYGIDIFDQILLDIGIYTQRTEFLEESLKVLRSCYAIESNAYIEALFQIGCLYSTENILLSEAIQTANTVLNEKHVLRTKTVFEAGVKAITTMRGEWIEGSEATSIVAVLVHCLDNFSALWYDSPNFQSVLIREIIPIVEDLYGWLSVGDKDQMVKRVTILREFSLKSNI